MKVLFLHPNTPDYLSSGLFHGLRTLLGKNCVDLPRFDCMYAPLSDGMRKKIRGNGFTLYGLLPDIPELAEERFFIWFKNIKEYDLYIIADIWNHWDAYQQLCKLVEPEKIIVIDPSDSPRIYPHNNHRNTFLKNVLNINRPFHNAIRYYKREFLNATSMSVGLPAPFSWLLQYKLPEQVLPINFSIPSSKITMIEPAHKKKLFTNNIVDEDVFKNFSTSHFIPLGMEKYSFESEQDYYTDIQQSKFGITTKRSGWDCLRHYEFAANGAILCFKQLSQKPASCAPHGLNEVNSIAYSNYHELMDKINALNDDAYVVMLNKSYDWIFENTTEAVANRMLQGL
ncbi:MAG TPA: hypothetical protein VLC98_12165 [Phnomibacter sp.]|nr:hypothetical protein [Phnomibacter sp.]